MKVFAKRAIPVALATLVLSGAALNSAAWAASASDKITEAEVVAAEAEWGQGIVHIGDVFSKGGDYKKAAEELIAKMYGYNDGTVLFKPTKASVDEFREDKDQALSYFVGGIDKEDHGFALAPWSKVRFDNKGFVIDQDSATAMGNYYFTDAKTGKDVKVDFTMGFKRAPKDGHLELFLHHSSLPFTPEK